MNGVEIDTALVEAKEVSKVFWVQVGRAQQVHAVERVSLRVAAGRSVGLIGESGCGKTTLGRMLCGLEPPTEGAVWFDGAPLWDRKGRVRRAVRTHMQMIFQDPAASLNPRFSVEATLKEAVSVHHRSRSRKERNAHIAALLSMVGLPVSCLDRLPFELSGGEKQRVAIARALAASPRFLVADDPVASLDMVSQEQVLRLLEGVQRRLGATLLLITHDLDAVMRLCATAAVMYAGRIVETNAVPALFSRPAHPYTKALLESRVRNRSGRRRAAMTVSGGPPSPLDPPSGCPFHPRCPFADIQCEKLVPQPRRSGSGTVSCHFDFDGTRRLTPKEVSGQWHVPVL